MAITNAQQAKQVMNEGRPMKKIKGQDHMLAYITPNEADKLVKLGGQETMTKEGIPAYPEYDNYGFSSQADFDSGDVSRSNDPNVRGEGPGQNRVTADQLAARNRAEEKAKEEREKQTLLDTIKQNAKNFNLNQRKKKRNFIRSNIDRDIRAGFNIVNPDINLTRSIKEMEMKAPPSTTYGDMVKEAVLGGSTFDNTGEEVLGTEFEQYSPKPGSNQEKYNYTPDFFRPIKPDSKSLTVQGAAGISNILGNIFMNKTPYASKLTDLADQYDKVSNLDLSKTTVSDMTKEFQPNRFAVENNMTYNPITKTFTKRDDGNDAYPQILPIVPEVNQKDDESDLAKLLANAPAYRFMNKGGIADVVGGEMDFESARQMYGLGKLVKKVTRGVKKIAKSPIGKFALGYALTGGLGNIASGSNFFSNFMRPTKFLGNTGSIFSKGGLQNIASRIGLGAMKSVKNPITDTVTREFAPNMLGKFLTSPIGMITAASALPLLGLGTGDESEDEAQAILDKTGINIEEIRANPEKYLSMRNLSEGGPGDLSKDPEYKGWKKMYEKNPDVGAMHEKHSEYLNFYERNKNAQAEGSKEPVAKETMPLLDMDGMEKDYRETGGFVDMGRMEKADDVPARLSKNEFVFTADAVRNAGDGSVDKGAEVMYNMMKNLESGGDVSEESQGLEGARKMFQTSQRLEEVI